MRNDRDSKYLRRILALAALALLLVLALIYGTKGALAMFPWFNDANVEAVLDERFDIQGVRRINLDVGSLTVEVCSTPQEQVRLVFQTNLPPDKRAELAVERDGDTLVVEQLPRARFGIFLNVHEKLTLYLPAGYQDALSLRLRSGNLSMTSLAGAHTFSSLSVALTSGNAEIGDIAAATYDVQASSGNVTLGNWCGEGRLKVTSGNIRLLSLAGARHELHSASGSIRIGSLAGEVSLRLTSGTLRVERFDGCGSFSSASGNIHLGIERIAGDINLHCTSGAVRATVPESLSFHFDAETLSGSVRTDFASTQSGRRTTAAVGASPAHTLRCNTTSGSIKVGY